MRRLLFLLSAVLLLHVWATGRWRLLGPQARRAAGALAWASVAEALQYVMVAKHPGVRYLLPALSLCGFAPLSPTVGGAERTRPAQLRTRSTSSM